MEVRFKTFLETFCVHRGEVCTHTTKNYNPEAEGRCAWPSKAYYIDRDSIDKFWAHYCNLISKKKWLTITEKPGSVSPLRADFDFVYSLERERSRFYSAVLPKLVSVFQNAIKSIVEPKVLTDKMLWCIVLEKPAPRLVDGKMKDGFHLQFPHFICDAWTMDTLIRDAVVAESISQKIWIGTPAEGRESTVMDSKMANKPWMLYGSMNYHDKTSVPYLYNNWPTTKTPRYGVVFDHKLKQITPDKLFQDEMSGRKLSVKYYLPQFLSVRLSGIGAVKLKSDIVDSRLNIAKKRKIPIVKKRRPEEVAADLQLIKDADIMSMLKDYRAENYTDWLDVGWTLFNIGEGCNDALDIWLEFSQRSDKFDRAECERLWDTMEMRSKTIGSLFHMAKKDSPERYQEFRDLDTRKMLFDSLGETKPHELDIAKVVYKMFGDRFLCSDAKKNVWYEFRGHMWYKTSGGIELLQLLVTDVLDKYLNLRSDLRLSETRYENYLDRLSAQSSEESDDAERVKKDKDYTAKQIKKISMVIECLKDSSFKERVLKECRIYMYNRTFEEVKDKKRRLLCCPNGVWDFQLMQFRDGRPDDFCTRSTKVPYLTTYTHDHPDVIWIKNYFEKVLVNQNMREYFLTAVSSSFEGFNKHKRLNICIGPSNGGKSTTFHLIEETFGFGQNGLSAKIPRELLVQRTNQNSSSGPRPELVRLEGPMLIDTQEITSKEQFNFGIIKELTGNDSIYARTHREDGGEMKIKGVIFIQCNSFPVMVSNDEAIWRRFRAVSFESTFVMPTDLKKQPVPKTHEKQMKKKRFHADPDINDKITELAPAFLWLLVEYYKKYRRLGLIEPPDVLAVTEHYQNQSDEYYQFIQDRVVKVPEDEAPTTSVTLKTLYNDFEIWFSTNFPAGKRKPGQNAFKVEMNTRLGLKVKDTSLYGFGLKSRYYGYTLIADEEEKEDNSKTINFVMETSAGVT